MSRVHLTLMYGMNVLYFDRKRQQYVSLKSHAVRFINKKSVSYFPLQKIAPVVIMDENLTVFVNRRKKLTTKEELEKCTKEVRMIELPI